MRYAVAKNKTEIESLELTHSTATHPIRLQAIVTRKSRGTMDDRFEIDAHGQVNCTTTMTLLEVIIERNKQLVFLSFSNNHNIYWTSDSSL